MNAMMTTAELLQKKDELHAFLAKPESRGNDAAAIAEIAAIRKEHKRRLLSAGVPSRFYS